MNAKVLIDVAVNGRGKVIIDGMDLSKYVSGVTVEMQVGKVTKVYLAIPAHCALDVVADVQLSISAFGEEVSKEMRHMLCGDADKEDETRL